MSINKRALNGTDAPSNVAIKIEDKPDPRCAASLIDTDFVCKPFPLSANEPPEITTMPAMTYPNADQEDTTPNDYRPLHQQHSFAPLVRACYATDATAAVETKTAAAVRRAEKNLKAEQQKAQPSDVAAMQAALEKAIGEEKEMSQPLEAESCVCAFDPYLKTLKITTEYVNRTGAPANVEVSLALHDGVRIVDSFVDMRGYTQEREFLLNEKAEAECKELNATANKGAARQTVSKFALNQRDIKVPAFGPGTDLPRSPAAFAVTFVVAFTDVDEHALRLPEEANKPAREVSDFAVQVPPSTGTSRVVPFTIVLLESKGTDERILPSRASAKLDAELRGAPTYWLGGTEAFSLTFRGPYAQPPLLRWRTVKEAFDASLDFELDALSGLAIDQQQQITAKVLHWVPFSPTECVASVELDSKRYVVGELGTSMPKTHHLVVSVDISGSMNMKVKGNTMSNRKTAFAELRQLCEKVKHLPANFVKGRIVGQKDRFVITIVRFHHCATTVFPRIALCEESTDGEIETALRSLENCGDTGGTCFTPCVREIGKHVRSTDYVTSLLLTDGQIFDQDEFVPALEALKKKVAGWKSAAIGCGAWANYATAKLIGTDGAVLLERFDPMVSSTALKLVGKCIADHATSLGVTIKSQVLTQWGKGEAPELVYTGTSEPYRGVNDVVSNMEMGLGAKRCFTVVGRFDAAGGTAMPILPPIVRVDGENNEYPISVSWDGAVRGADGVLRVFDPLFCAKGVKKLKLKDTVGIHERIMEGIGEREQCTTSRTTARTKFHFQECDNNALDEDTRAKVPESLEGAIKHDDLAWLPQHACYQGGYSCGLSGGDGLGAPIGAPEAAPAFRSLSAADDGEAAPAFRSLSADDEAMPTAAAPEKAEVETEELADPNGVPSFDGMANSFGNAKVRFYLRSPELAAGAAKDIVATLKVAVEGLGKLATSKVHDGAPMDLDSLLEETAGPSLKDLTANLPELFSVLNCFALRFHILAHFDEFVHHLGSSDEEIGIACDAPKALSRAKYLLRFAEKLAGKLAAMTAAM